MFNVKCLFSLIIFAIALTEICGHGMVMDPVSRSSAWRENFNTPKNVDDNQLYCGGASVQHVQLGGKCGVCGDSFDMKRPRPNENGGEFGKGVIVKHYKPGQNITIKVRITANHKGNFYFSVCPLADSKQLETEECFDKYPVKLANGQDSYELKSDLKGDIPINVVLPKNVTCDHCVFRWQWITGNSWGNCKDGTSRLGCGPQEEFRTCSDVTIN